jgi:hypothetical protein
MQMFTKGATLGIILIIMIAIAIQVVMFWMEYFKNIGTMLSQ